MVTSQRRGVRSPEDGLAGTTWGRQGSGDVPCHLAEGVVEVQYTCNRICRPLHLPCLRATSDQEEHDEGGTAWQAYVNRARYRFRSLSQGGARPDGSGAGGHTGCRVQLRRNRPRAVRLGAEGPHTLAYRQAGGCGSRQDQRVAACLPRPGERQQALHDRSLPPTRGARGCRKRLW